MSEQPKKRPWLQFHLSTLIIVMLVASLLLGVNILGWQIEEATKPVVVGYRPGMRVVFINAHSTLGLPFYLRILSIPTLIGVAAFCEWLIRRRERRQ